MINLKKAKKLDWFKVFTKIIFSTLFILGTLFLIVVLYNIWTKYQFIYDKLFLSIIFLIAYWLSVYEIKSFFD